MPFSHLQRRDYCDLLKGTDGYRCKLMTLMNSPVKLYKAQNIAQPRRAANKAAVCRKKTKGSLGTVSQRIKTKEGEKEKGKHQMAFMQCLVLFMSLEALRAQIDLRSIIYSPLTPKSLV